jgi:predicted TIM-barrel enzyme
MYHRLADTIPLDCPGVWTDESGIFEEKSRIDTEYARRFTRGLQSRFRNILWFGGIGFKGQPGSKNIPKIARSAKHFMDVVTTSGDRTGVAPSVEKVRAIRNAIGDHPLAIASGITPENVHAFKSYANCFLVASSISKSFTELDPILVGAMADAIHE